MSTSLKYAQMVWFTLWFPIDILLTISCPQALHLQPSDKAIVYNIAMIEQKAAEMLFTVPSAKRSLKDMQRAIEQAGHAQK